MSSALIPIAVDFAKVSATIGSKDETLLDLLLKKYHEKFVEVDEIADELEEDDDTEDDEEDDEENRLASLQALSQLLGKAKKDLEGGIAPGKALSGLGQSPDISKQHQDALKNLLNDSEDDEDDNADSYASATDVMRHLITGEKPARRVAFKFMYGHAIQCLCQHLGQELPHDQWLDLHGSSWAKSLDKALKSVGVPAKTLSIAKYLTDRGAPFKQIPKYSDNPAIGYLTVAEVGSALAALQNAKLDTLDQETRTFLEDIRVWLQTCTDTKRDLICFGS